MGISDLIAGFIQDALDEANGVLELQRSDLAQRFGCVPSQINYVMSTRFSPEHGYIVESRRGGGGYIRIRRVQMDRQTLLMHVINSIGGELDGRSEKIGYKIREAQLQKTPYMLIVGQKELESGAVSVRSRSEGDLGAMTADAFIEKAKAEIAAKAYSL